MNLDPYSDKCFANLAFSDLKIKYISDKWSKNTILSQLQYFRQSANHFNSYT